MLVHKGGQIKNWGGECRDVTLTKLQSQNIYTGGLVGQDGCERRIKVFVTIFFFFLGGGGRVSGGGVGLGGQGSRVDVNREVKFL